jgi:hypothetical protein
MMDDQQMTPNDAKEANQEGFLAFLCDHLVLLGGTYVDLDGEGRDKSEERFFSLPGIIMSVRGVWWLVTAGHVIEELEGGLTAGKARLTNCCLAAHFGSKAAAEQTIPFDFQSSSMYHPINNEAAGLDFALLPLTEEQRAALAENGIRPVFEENWNQQRVEACEVFALLGAPHCLVSDRTRLVPYGDGVAGIINPTLVSVHRIELSPDEMPDSTYPWFVGVVGASSGLPNIVGMSGGPIFGFFKGAAGRWQYWIVALQSRWNEERRIVFACQSRWNEERRIVFACQIPVIAQVVEQELQRYVES